MNYEKKMNYENVDQLNKNVIKNLNDTILYLTEQLNNRELVISNLIEENDYYRNIVHNQAKCFEQIQEEKRKFDLKFQQEEQRFEKIYNDERKKRYYEFSSKRQKK
jgi:hypothetical protein